MSAEVKPENGQVYPTPVLWRVRTGFMMGSFDRQASYARKALQRSMISAGYLGVNLYLRGTGSPYKPIQVAQEQLQQTPAAGQIFKFQAFQKKRFKNWPTMSLIQEVSAIR